DEEEVAEDEDSDDEDVQVEDETANRPSPGLVDTTAGRDRGTTATVVERRSVTELRLDEQSRLAGPTSDHVRMYLKEIGRVSLLSGEEEVDLARRVESGLHASQQLTELGELHGDL